MGRSIEFSIISETHTLREGGDRDRFRTSLAAALRMIPEDGSAEVLVADVWESNAMERLIAQEFPRARYIAAKGLGYDAAKAMAAKEAYGRYLLFLDGDCIPEAGWHHRMLEFLRSGRDVACGGYTRYEGGFLAALMSVMDFGFLYPRVEHRLKCYASNNCAFLREAFEEEPMSQVDIRCSCYYHAQRMIRRGTPMRLVPEARVLHEIQPFVRERSRQGYDTIAACWVDPKVPEACWLRLGMFSLPLFYAARNLFDWKRVLMGGRDLKLAFWQVILSLPLFSIFRLLDVAGMVRAFLRGQTKGGWGGF